MPTTPPDATLVMVNGNEEAALGFLQSQSLHSPRPTLLALLSARSAGLMKRALRSGADEILFMPLDPGEATRALLKVSEARWRTERREGGVVISVTSLVGGVGVTSLAANLALALESLHQRVALVDLDLQTGGLAVFLNLDPEVTIMPLVRLEHKLDSIQLESALTKHPSGVYLLAAPKRIEEGELVSDLTVGTVLDLIRQLFDYVIVDCGDHVDENGVAAWERSEHLFYVLNQSIAAARSAWRFIDLFERLGLTTLEPHFILDRYNPSHPLTEKAIETTLAKSIYARIPADDRTFETIELKAQDLFQLAPHLPGRARDAGSGGAGDAAGRTGRAPANIHLAAQIRLRARIEVDEVCKMGLTDRLSNSTKGGRSADTASASGSLIGATVRRRKDAIADSSRRLKVKVHNKLFETIDVSKLETLEPAMVSSKVTAAINDILNEDGRLLTDADRGRLVEELKNELLGLGPLEPLLRDDEITDILVNGHDQVYVEKRGKLHATDVVFQDDEHLMLIIDRIVSRVGRRVDESSPMVDARSARRLAYQRDHSAAGARRPGALDSPFRQASLRHRRAGRKGAL